MLGSFTEIVIRLPPWRGADCLDCIEWADCVDCTGIDGDSVCTEVADCVCTLYFLLPALDKIFILLPIISISIGLSETCNIAP